ncbi:MAG: 4-hydroxythreonine-4-phosphate dehydrogenase PdxA [Bacteroidia bacterium]|nr:4-hydroxythreonine-4-phosphate dehydrogenase PdxA [Bacteroidia bacterium]
MSEKKIVVGITHGDINGIGYEIIIKCLSDVKITEICTPIVYGSSKVASYHRKALNIENFSFNQIRNASEANPKRANIINCTDEEVKVDPGKSTPESGKAAFDALQRAVSDLQKGEIDVLVTAPINKESIQSKDFKFPGHTEYFQQKWQSENVLMFMVSDKMKIGVVTGHIPISEVSKNISAKKIIEKLRIINRSLIEDFGIRRPRIAVLGLNPHSGDNGLIGNEEQTEIIPALKTARDEKIMALGPYPADGFFSSGNYMKFDAVLAMYHDQGLIPFKSLASDDGVNFTAGLPIVRTSPAHGTAYDIVDKNLATPDSFRKALYMACDIFRKRIEYRNLTANPLVVQDNGNCQ